MEDDLNIFEKGRRPQFIENERRPQFFEMEDDLMFLVNGRLKKIIKKIMQPETLKIQTRVVAPLRVNLVIIYSSNNLISDIH